MNFFTFCCTFSQSVSEKTIKNQSWNFNPWIWIVKFEEAEQSRTEQSEFWLNSLFQRAFELEANEF